MMHARPIRPYKTKQLPNSFGLTGLAPVAWHKLRLSLYIFSRILFVFILSQSWLAYLQKIGSIYIFTTGPFVPALTNSPHVSYATWVTHMQLPTYSPIHYCS